MIDIDRQIVSDLNKGDDFWSFHKNGVRDYVHGFFAYPAMMVPQMQREIISIFKSRINNNNLTIYDPFMGSGTVLIEAMLQGINVVGVDINPLAYLVSKVKTTIYSITKLRSSITNLEKNIANEIVEPNRIAFDNIDKWFKEDIRLELEHIRNQIMLEPVKKHRRYFWVAFSETIRMVSNSRSSTYKLHIKSKEDIESYNKSPISIFTQILQKNFKSTNEFQETLFNRGYLIKCKNNSLKYKSNIDLRLGDSIVETKEVCKVHDINMIITSPPYGDNQTTVTYGQYSVLALKWMDMSDICSGVDKSLIDTFSKIDRVSMGGTRIKSCEENILKSSKHLRDNIQSISNKDETKVNKVMSFYSDFYDFIKNLSVVASGSYVIMTVGNRSVAKNRVEMDSILVDYFESFDFEFIHKFNRDILNKRMPKVNRTDKITGEKSETMTKEYVLILKKR